MAAEPPESLSSPVAKGSTSVIPDNSGRDTSEKMMPPLWFDLSRKIVVVIARLSFLEGCRYRFFAALDARGDSTFEVDFGPREEFLFVDVH